MLIEREVLKKPEELKSKEQNSESKKENSGIKSPLKMYGETGNDKSSLQFNKEIIGPRLLSQNYANSIIQINTATRESTVDNPCKPLNFSSPEGWIEQTRLY